MFQIRIERKIDRVLAYTVVAAQFVLAALIVLTTRLVPLCYGCLAVTAAGGALSVWAWLVMGLRRLNVLPHVRGDAQLVTAMPYRFIRHPMYTGLLLFCSGLIATNYGHWKLVAWVLLAIMLDVKARLEERLLCERFSDYDGYRRRTWRFVPLVY